MHCTAKSKRSGQKCRNKPVKGRTVCRMHGGKSLRGIAHPNYKEGRYAKDLPLSLAKEFDPNVDSRKLTSLGEDIALNDLRIGELLRKLKEKGEPLHSPTWEKIWKALEHRRKLVEAYDKHALIYHRYVPVEEVRQVLEQIATLTRTAVLGHTDPVTGNKILRTLSEKKQRFSSHKANKDKKNI